MRIENGICVEFRLSCNGFSTIFFCKPAVKLIIPSIWSRKFIERTIHCYIHICDIDPCGKRARTTPNSARLTPVPTAAGAADGSTRTVDTASGHAALSRAWRVFARAPAPAGPAASAVVRTGREGVTDGHELA